MKIVRTLGCSTHSICLGDVLLMVPEMWTLEMKEPSCYMRGVASEALIQKVLASPKFSSLDGCCLQKNFSML
jgi:hypothetical protein